MKRSFANVRIRAIGLGLTLLAAATSVGAQTPSAGLSEALRDNLCQRIQMPLIFATRDTTFALSLPTDEAIFDHWIDTAGAERP